MTGSRLNVRLCDLAEYAEITLQTLRDSGINSMEALVRAANARFLEEVETAEGHCISVGNSATEESTAAIGINYFLKSSNSPLRFISANISKKTPAGRIDFLCQKSEIDGYKTLPYGNIFKHSRSIPQCDFKRLCVEIENLRGYQ